MDGCVDVSKFTPKTRWRAWTKDEFETVRKIYPVGGVEACLAAMNRTRSSIYNAARLMKLRAPGYTGVRKRWPHDAVLDQRIRELHMRPIKRGDIETFAQTVNRPPWWVSKRAREMGLRTPRFREPPWSAAEVEILEASAHLSSEVISRRLKSAGFMRSATAVVVHRKRLGIGVKAARSDAGIYNALQLADLLGVDSKTPLRWIKMHGLRARVEAEQHFVRAKDLRAWLLDHPYTFTLRRVPGGNQPWFLDLIAGRET